jgi:predicted Zn-dependent peptidase
VELVEAVTQDDIKRVAKRLLDERKLSLAIVGPFRSDKKFAELLKL